MRGKWKFIFWLCGRMKVCDKMKESNAFHQFQDKLTSLLGNEILPQSIQSLTPISAFYLSVIICFSKEINIHYALLYTAFKRITEVRIIQVKEIISKNLHNYFKVLLFKARNWQTFPHVHLLVQNSTLVQRPLLW